MKKLIIIVTTFLTFNIYAQITFEKCYFISNSNEKVNCLIKNNDWKLNPSEIKYKLSENSEAKTAYLKGVKEFGFFGDAKYVRRNIKIDRSSSNINNLSKQRNPVFKEEQIFLKLLIEGEASLYIYEDIGLKRYFYNINSSNIEQLVFKSYVTDKNQIKKNNLFKQHLL
jgi:hypothetical protein